MALRNLLSLLPLIFLPLTLYSQTQRNNYSQKINGSDLQIEMISIPEGTFLMGSPETEKGRKPDEGPIKNVQLDGFWMSKYEITWDLFYLYLNRKIDGVDEETKGTEVSLDIDAVAGATKPYVDMSLGMGIEGFPVVNVTQLAASKFCEWLSAKTGHFYRLPTEAEWEYACRAGTTTAYHFGDDPTLLEEYAWYYDNSDVTYHKGGQKKPNPWGLYDMHGNVAEWTLDQYHSERYKQNNAEVLHNPWEMAVNRYPISVRGGSWDDDGAVLRSAARVSSTPDWIIRDPQLPKSQWWNTDASFVGFRVVRALPPGDTAKLQDYWIQQDKNKP